MEYTKEQQRVYDLINFIIDNENRLNNESNENYDMEFVFHLQNHFDLFKACPDLIRFFKECCHEWSDFDDHISDDITEDMAYVCGDEKFAEEIRIGEQARYFEDRFRYEYKINADECAKYFLGKINQHFGLNLPEDYLDQKINRTIKSTDFSNIEEIAKQCVDKIKQMDGWRSFDRNQYVKNIENIRISYSLDTGNITIKDSSNELNFSSKDITLEDVMLSGTDKQVQEVKSIYNLEAFVRNLLDKTKEVERDNNTR